ncbi:hypothetical protein [Roseateles microcysteis]|uniref:hypothetical protein n=1 Tax=Roseateles microcysteis TaxID=3119057 RepID=UPI002FE69E10
MRAMLAWVMAGFFLGVPGAAAFPVAGKITLDDVAAHGLIPTQPTPDKAGRWASTPYFKLYSEGRLVFAGLSADARQMASTATGKKQARIHGDVKPRSLASEMATLKIKRAGTGARVLVVYVSDPCPPCDSLIAGAVSSLQPLGSGAIEQLRVVVH